MAKLDVYRAKRDFGVTPEPAAAEAPRRRLGPAPTFVVHKHHARSLHYDLRLEIEGVLASWAVPKGPSYDPADKRLAVETEDHPLAYGGFEGRIPDGEYGAGDSLLWDRGTWDTVPPGQAVAQRHKGHLELELRGEKLRGRWHLVRTQRQEGKPAWLLLKARDEAARPGYDVVAARPESVTSGRSVTRGPVSERTVRAPHPPPIELLVRVWPPMPASPATEADVRQGDLLEVKYGGLRALAALSGGRVALQGQDALDLSARFPEVATSLARIVAGEAVLDGEIVMPKRARARSRPAKRGAARGGYAAFDLLWLEGEDLRARPFEERRQLLESLLAVAPEPVWVTEEVPGPLSEALAQAHREGWDGITARRPGSRYGGRRSHAWMEIQPDRPHRGAARRRP